MSCCGGALGLATRSVDRWMVVPNATTLPSDGLQVATIVGTGTARLPTATDIQGASRRVGIVSAGAANSVAGARCNVAQTVNGVVTLGTGRYPGGGWRFVMEWSISDAALNTEAKMFCGMTTNLAAPTAVDPSTLNDSIGFGCNTGDTNLSLYARDNATSTVVPLGATFPVNTTGANTFWRAVIDCAPGQTANPCSFTWQVERLQTGHTASGTIAVGPRFDRQMTIQMWRATGPVVVSPVGIDVHMVMLETRV